MYAIVEIAGKQYRVSPNKNLNVEYLEKEKGDTVEFDRVLFLAEDGKYQAGRPYLQGAKVTAQVVTQGKGKKILVFKYKAKKGYRRRMGHRQLFTQLLIKEINAGK